MRQNDIKLVNMEGDSGNKETLTHLNNTGTPTLKQVSPTNSSTSSSNKP